MKETKLEFALLKRGKAMVECKEYDIIYLYTYINTHLNIYGHLFLYGSSCPGKCHLDKGNKEVKELLLLLPFEC